VAFKAEFINHLYCPFFICCIAVYNFGRRLQRINTFMKKYNYKMVRMDTDVYLKKVCTVAFRMTGDKKVACELAVHAVLK